MNQSEQAQEIKEQKIQINNKNEQQEVKADVNSNSKTNISTNNIRENKY